MLSFWSRRTQNGKAYGIIFLYLYSRRIYYVCRSIISFIARICLRRHWINYVHSLLVLSGHFLINFFRIHHRNFAMHVMQSKRYVSWGAILGVAEMENEQNLSISLEICTLISLGCDTTNSVVSFPASVLSIYSSCSSASPSSLSSIAWYSCGKSLLYVICNNSQCYWILLFFLCPLNQEGESIRRWSTIYPFNDWLIRFTKLSQLVE